MMFKFTIPNRENETKYSPPIANAKNVKEVSELSKLLGIPYGKEMRKMRDLQKAYYDTDDDAKKRKLVTEIYDYADELLIDFKQQKAFRESNPNFVENLASDIVNKKISLKEASVKLKNLKVNEEQRVSIIKKVEKEIKEMLKNKQE